MADILSDLPILVSCLIRREFTQNFKSGHGEFIPGHLLGIRCQEGHSLQFQVRFEDATHGGAMFCLPIQALCWKPCAQPPADLTQPWDTFSEHFAVHAFTLLKNSRAWLLNHHSPEFQPRLEARYLFTVDFSGNALADCFEQHKQLHILQVAEGWFAAVPNNRLISDDTAFAKIPTDLPRFESLAADFCGECTFHLPSPAKPKPNPPQIQKAGIWKNGPRYRNKPGTKIPKS